MVEPARKNRNRKSPIPTKSGALQQNKEIKEDQGSSLNGGFSMGYILLQEGQMDTRQLKDGHSNCSPKPLLLVLVIFVFYKGYLIFETQKDKKIPDIKYF